MQMHIFHSKIQSMICTVTFPNQLRAKNANEYATELKALQYSARFAQNGKPKCKWNKTDGCDLFSLIR